MGLFSKKDTQDKVEMFKTNEEDLKREKIDEYKKRQEKILQDYYSKAVDSWEKLIRSKTIVQKMDEEIEMAELKTLTNEEKEKLELFRAFRKAFAAAEKIAIKKNQKDFFEYALDLNNLGPYDMKINFDVFKKCSDADIKVELMSLDATIKTILKSDTKTNETQKSGPRK